MEKVAIIGLSCLFPGSQTPDQYWQNLINRSDLTSLATVNQMGVDPNIFYHPSRGKQDKYYCLRGGYIQDFQFDPTGYQIPSDKLCELDVSYQWSLYVAQQALKDSGYADSSILARCGVILGNLCFPTRSSHALFAPLYHQAIGTALQELLNAPSFQLPPPATPSVSIDGVMSGYAAALIAQALGLSGGHFSLDAACASSLYAIHLACQYLASRKADLMLAGAVSAADPFFINMGFSIFQAYPEDGRTCPFDRSSGGLIAGEGAGMVVLKRYHDALRDGDRIYATIAGIGLSNDGKGKFVLSPNPKGQILAFERAYADARICPTQIDYVECHATGTPLGDSTEINSMAAFFGQYGAKPLLGSVKSNLGHLLTSAGMAGLIKVILSMRHNVIPPTIHLKDPLNSERGWLTSEQIVQSATPWHGSSSTQSSSTLKRAAVSAFGFGGTNAHLILESVTLNSSEQEPSVLRALAQPATASSPTPSKPLAITGMDVCFGGCDGLVAFDRTLYQGTQHFTSLPSQRWQGMENQISTIGKAPGVAPNGAYLEAFDLDLLRFKIPPREEDCLIPQQLLMLKVTDNAIRDAGLTEGSHVAVLIAMGTELSLHQFRGRVDLSWQIQQSLKQANITLSPTELAELEAIAKNSLHPAAQVNQYTSFIGNIMACRIAALWDFSGSAMTISAEENSVLRACDVAELLLSDPTLEAVVVGAVDLAGGIERVFSRAAISPINTGTHTLSYDQNVNGWMIGDGAGAIVLQRHQDLPKGNRVYAAIDAIRFNRKQASSERFGSLPAAPSAVAVTDACQQVFEAAGISSSTIGYLEVFGSGVAAEDAAEIQGLIHSYSVQDSAKSCCIGSVKANIGHAGVASGMASLIKTALCLYHRYLPGTPQWSGPKPIANWKDSPFYVLPRSKFWFLAADISQRRAAVNSLAIDGTCAHAILSEASHPSQPQLLQDQSFYLFPVSANTAPELQNQLEQLHQVISTCDSLSQTAIETYQTFQQAKGAYHLTIVGSNRTELCREISLMKPGIARAFARTGEWKTPLGSYFTANPFGNQGSIAFVYPGMSSADIEIGRDLFRLFPQLYDRFATLSTDVNEVLHEKLIYPRSLIRPSQHDQIEQSQQFFNNAVAMCQSSISFAVLYTLILREYFQVNPQMACGYSLGEASSMWFSLGVWQDRYHTHASSATTALATSPLFQTELCGECTTAGELMGLPLESERTHPFWRSYLLKASALDVQTFLGPELKVYLTFINSPQEVAIAGEPTHCLSIIQQLGCRFFEIPFNSVLHCDLARSRYQELANLHTLPIQQIPEIKFYSAVTSDRLPITREAIAHNSAQLCCQVVDFPRLIQRIYDDGARIFIEVGPKDNCTQWIRQILKQDYVAASIHIKGVEDRVGIIKLLAQLVSHGVPLDLSPLYGVPSGEMLLGKVSAAPHPHVVRRAIALGRQRIQDVILTPTNKEKFKQMTSNSPEFKPSQATYNSISQQLLKFAQLQIGSHQKRDRSSTALPTLPSSAIIWDEADLLEFARGSIASVFGSDYQKIDTYPRRVRLPEPPYLLVSRVTAIQAEKGKFQPSSITTEYDIPHNAWYSVDGQVPWAVTVESGQCDLLLISYLGIDFENKGKFVYRLLDCTLTFLEDLPKEGDILRYDIQIDSFVRNGDNLLFFFSYKCFVKDVMILKMDGGCAGFFSDPQLEQGKGIIVSEKELATRRTINKLRFEPFLVCQKIAFDTSDILHLSHGNLADCFGDHYGQYGLNPSLRLPPESILMIDRVVSVDPTGGDWGLGLIVGEKQLEPDHWYFPCHFKDDRVMAGSLMAEGCGQLLQFYLLYLGLHTCTIDARFQPIPGLPQVVRCRGQVKPISAPLVYRMEITEIGLQPQLYAKCNVAIILNGKTVVHFQDLGLQLSEKIKKKQSNSFHPSLANPKLLEIPNSTPTTFTIGPSASNTSVLLSREQIEEFCIGSIAKCFGPEYAIYDRGIVMASRMPNTHLNLVHRVLDIKGTRHQLSKGSTIWTAYDMPINPWFYRQNSSFALPYSILMEIGLQPCGFLSAYLGTTFLYSEQSLYFRNLDGQGHLIQLPELRGKTIGNTATLLSTSNIQGMILQSFTFQVSCNGQVFYEGLASFGHFSAAALANQVGLDRGKELLPWFQTEAAQSYSAQAIHLKQPEIRHQYNLQHRNHNGKSPHIQLPQHQLDLLHDAIIIAGGGQHQKGYIYAWKAVKPTDWYFNCHFYLDPVMPGSLGVEAILQAMQIYARSLEAFQLMQSPRFALLDRHQMVWKYRGQIPHGSTEMQLEVHLSQIVIQSDRITLIGDASLWRANLRIYEVKNVGISVVDTEQ